MVNEAEKAANLQQCGVGRRPGFEAESFELFGPLERHQQEREFEERKCSYCVFHTKNIYYDKDLQIRDE